MTGRRGLPHLLAVHPLLRVVSQLDLRPGPVLLAVGAGALALGSAVTLIGVSAWLVARASEQPAVVEVSLAIVAVRALGISRGVFRYLERLASHDVALSGLVRLRELCYAALAATEPAVVTRLRRGDLLARLGADVDAVGDTLVRGLLPFAVTAVVGIGAVATTVALLPTAALPLLVGLLLAGALAPWLSAHAAQRAEVGAARARVAVAEQTQGLLDGLAELEVAGAVTGLRAELAAAEHHLTRALDVAARPAALAAGTQVIAAGIAVVGALLLGAGPVASGAMPAVWLPVVVLLPLAAFEATTVLPAAALEVVRGTTAARRLLELLDEAVEQVQAAPGTVTPGPAPHRLTARGLACGWTDCEPVLQGVDLDVEPGQVLALVGGSGTGKSTLLMTLAGLLAPLAGTVRLDGVDLTELDPFSLRSVVSYTSEDAHVFATTVRENLRVAAGDVGDPVLLAALDDAGLGEWVRGLPSGLDTLLGSGGHDASGGQRRRLLLARALLTGADVLLLDEAEEHLDPDGASALIQDLRAAARRSCRAIVLATHRGTGLPEFDRVISLNGGRALIGRHQSVLQQRAFGSV